MKKQITTLALSIGFFSLLSQDITFEHPGGRAAILAKSRIAEATKLTDLGVQDIKKAYKTDVDILSVNITVVTGDGKVTVSGSSEELSAAQRDLLGRAALGSEISVKVDYRFRTVNRHGDTSPRTTEYALTPGPEIEAEFPGGKDQMLEYVKQNLTNNFEDKEMLKDLSHASVAFVVNEDGEVTETTLYRSTGNKKMDNQVVELIRNMPSWKPAEFSKGVKMKQKFVVSIPAQKILKPGKGGDGC